MNMPSICIQLYVLGLLVMMGSRAEGVLYTPSTANHTPSTANLSPSTANLSPSTANLNPSTANLTPSTANLNPSTANLNPSTANLTPSTANPTPSTAVLSPSTANLSPSTAVLSPSTANLSPSTANLNPSTANLNPSTANQTPSAANEIDQTTSSGLTALSHSQGWESTGTTETISAPVSTTRGSDIAGEPRKAERVTTLVLRYTRIALLGSTAPVCARRAGETTHHPHQISTRTLRNALDSCARSYPRAGYVPTTSR
ncbi:DNA-directed RNA polymerase II subunit RPB1-like [Salvelinus namaycush]|uniref:DNA-directed RNA polymerase II subunit RPB1-like n=1 Tax=Salvelinus namaycush TaxID=8040 RepID=A0A8U0PTN9_SALNM|nr:DNA-directed RNA polymerase II subunit RPB1-like [Salvelinus namaycush]